MLNLPDLAAAALAFTLMMYVLLDGADLGVGMLFGWFHGEEERHRLALTILPLWDANETWLVLLAGGLLALFPAAAAQLFTALYIPLFIMLFALFVRAFALEYRGHASARTKRLLDRAFALGSATAAFFQGALTGAMLNGVSSGSWFSLTSALCGCGAMAGYLLLGCCWTRWRLGGETGERASLLAGLFLVIAIVMTIGVALLLPARLEATWHFAAGKAFCAAAGALCIALPVLLYGERPFAPLLAALLLTVCWLAAGMLSVWPWLIPDLLPLNATAASPVAQRFVLWGLAVVMPLTLAYNSWAFRVLKGRVI
ncbi:cytochrome d ubiquinol oxidase subunit II [Erwinia oleae]|uniref:cytochrome d ubiquinol oxidase subunit II n=1 Tax=Erwinia oleae TaxID=796334 RepID=UPI00068B5E0D|nr:cytochrome d ubiquinol oxidase subunit II [Erwinia oleae]